MAVRWADRRVRHARLFAPDRSRARRGAIVLEDALATASLPGAGTARLVVVRALALGRIHVDRPPAALALAIERAVAGLRSALVYAEDPRAPSAPAVWFADIADARAALAVRLARGPAPREWFWPLAVPGWRGGADTRGALRSLVLTATRPPAEPHEAIALAAALAARGALDTTLASLEPADGAALLAALGVRQPIGANALPLGEAPDERRGPAAPWRPVLERWVPRWGPRDARAWWLAAVALIAERPARVLDAGLTARVAAVVDDVVGRSPASVSARVSSTPRPPAPLVPSPPPTDAVSPTPDDPSVLASVEHPPVSLEGPASVNAGLLLLVPLLARLGLGRRLRAAPWLIELDLPRCVLAHLADRLRVPPDDPVRAALALPGVRTAVPPTLSAPVVAWLAAARGWARRRLGLSLAALVRRPGRLGVTRTHLDVIFDLRTADIRIRRAALDVDPGWVDWLGRVVAFRYE